MATMLHTQLLLFFRLKEFRYEISCFKMRTFSILGQWFLFLPQYLYRIVHEIWDVVWIVSQLKLKSFRVSNVNVRFVFAHNEFIWEINSFETIFHFFSRKNSRSGEKSNFNQIYRYVDMTFERLVESKYNKEENPDGLTSQGKIDSFLANNKYQTNCQLGRNKKNKKKKK